MIKQVYGKVVPHLGTIVKIDKHVVDAIYQRAEIHVTLLVRLDATAKAERPRSSSCGSSRAA